MNSQLFTTFVQTEVFDDLMDIDTPITKSSILSKRGQNKKVCWEESVVDNEYKHTIRKDTYYADLCQQLVTLQDGLVEQEALIQRQVGEIKRLKGLWGQAQQIGAIPEGFEQYATAYGTAQEVNAAIKNKLWELLLELKPKREKSDKILAHMHKEQHKIEKKLKILTSSMALRSQPPTLIENHMIQTTTEDYGEIF